MRTAVILPLALLVFSSPGLAHPSKAQPKPPDGLRDCAGGGIVLPGSAACLRLGGAVTSSVTVGSRARPTVGTLRLGRGGTRLEATGRVDADVRVPTEAGPLRVYSSVRLRAPGAALP